MPGALELLIVQPTPFCNIACDYCYLPDRDVKTRVTDEVLDAIFGRVFESHLVQHDFTIVWHAGEPLSAGLPFYRNAFAIARRHAAAHPYRHSIQTNATLIDDAWCAFFRENDVDVGVSLDGPAFLHDAHRKTRSGRGTFDRVMRGVESLRRNGIDFHVITVLTRGSLRHAEALFNFYRENGIRRIGFNFEERDGIHETSTLDADGIDAEARAFLSEFLRLTVEGDYRISVREFDGLGDFMLRGRGFVGQRCQESDPFRILTFDIHGNFCTFSPELLGVRSEAYGGDFVIGNVLRDRIEDVVASPKLRRIAADIEEGVRLCRESCDYFGVCGGGQASNKFCENGTFASTETLSCRLSKKALVDAMLAVFEDKLGLSTLARSAP